MVEDENGHILANSQQYFEQIEELLLSAGEYT
jgi:hypothetical protein